MKKSKKKKTSILSRFKELIKFRNKITKEKVSDFIIYKKHIGKIKKKNDFQVKINKIYNKENNETTFNVKKFFYFVLVVLCVFTIGYIIVAIKNDYDERERLHVISEKKYEVVSDKEKVLIDSQNKINQKEQNNLILKADNLNAAFMYDQLIDDIDKKNTSDLPMPSFLNEEMDEVTLIDQSVAGQMYRKLKSKNDEFVSMLLDKSFEDPVYTVRQYHYDGHKILGSYNPKNSKHIKNKPVTYFIDHFSNVNIDFYDADGEKMDNYKNIQDILSMASVYTYYHNPYDIKTFMNYCNELYDKSYTYVASLSEVYYCSGCMDYPNPDVEVKTVTLSHIPDSLMEQKVENDIYEEKAGTLQKMDLSKININNYTYEQYVNDIKTNGHNNIHNYCSGHIDLNVKVTCKCLNNVDGLLNIDAYGNSGRNYIESWHGWEKDKINKALTLTNKDWEQEYGLVIDDIDYLKPLQDEHINYYMSTLPKDISNDRKKLIETALRSVSRIPYYYAGKAYHYGYVGNAFNTRVKADYNGRVLKGLDCSGWINWVYWTAFNKKIVKNEGTAGLVKEGSRIQRIELQPGDILVRPGYDSHVMMFLSFAEDGKVKVIHENGSVNNVSIATYEAYYPYYRKIFAK